MSNIRKWKAVSQVNDDVETRVDFEVYARDRDSAMDLTLDKACTVFTLDHDDQVIVAELLDTESHELWRWNGEGWDYQGGIGSRVDNPPDRMIVVCRILKDRGYSAEYEFPGFICIQQGGLEFNAGTGAGHWGMDTTRDWDYLGGDENQDLTDQSDPIEIADWIVATFGKSLDKYHGLREAS